MEVISLASKYKTPFQYSTLSVPGEENLFKDTSNTSYCSLRAASGTRGDILLHGFDISSLPENAEIKRVYFKAKIKGNSLEYHSNFVMGICVGNTVIKSQNVNITSSAAMYTIEADTALSTIDINQIGFSFAYNLSSDWSSYIQFYGLELHIEYEETIKGTVRLIPTNFVTPYKLNRFIEGGMYNADTLDNALTDADSETYAALSTDGYGINCDIKYDQFTSAEIPDNCKIDLAFARIKLLYEYYESADLHVLVYSGNRKIGESQLYIDNEEVNTFYVNLPNFRKDYLKNLSFVIQLISKDKYKTSFYLYGMDLNLEYSEGEEPIIIESVVTQGYSKKPDVVSGGAGIVTNDTPNTDGYIGNLYNDDLDDYAEFTYVPNTDLPEDTPEEELRTLGMIKIDSPTFTSFGIPNNATITSVKLTKLSEKTCEHNEPICDLYLQIGGEKYDKRAFVPTNGFTTNVYDSQDISIHKLDLIDDKVSFMLEWKSYDTPFNLRVKYLLWDINYTIGDRDYSVQFNNSDIEKFSVGQKEVMTVYIGTTRIYG